MARALMGHLGMPADQALAYEVARLRRRVAELEGEIERLRASKNATLDLELHRMAEETSPVPA